MKLIVFVLILSILLTSCTLGDVPPNNGDSTDTTSDATAGTMSQAEIDTLLESAVHFTTSGPYAGYIDFDSELAYQTWIEHVDVTEFEGEKVIGYCHYRDIDKWILTVRAKGLPTLRKSGTEFQLQNGCTLHGFNAPYYGVMLRGKYQDGAGETLVICYSPLDSNDIESINNNFEGGMRNILWLSDETGTAVTLRFQNGEYPALVSRASSDSNVEYKLYIHVFVEKYNMVISLDLKSDWTMEELEEYLADFAIG